MNLDRGLIKHQAKTMMKGKVGKLFLTSFVVTLIVTILFYAGTFAAGMAGTFSAFNSNYLDEYSTDNSDSDYFDDFDYSDERADFESFGTAYTGGEPSVSSAAVTTDKYVIGQDGTGNAIWAAVASFFMALGSIAMFVLLPLTVTLRGFYVLFIRNKEFELGDGIKWTFKNTFNKTYLKKLGAILLIGLITSLLTYLFFVPAIIFAYSAYFVFEIMCDNPELGPWEAIKLSRKMIRGNRSELFVLDLSFILWDIACVLFFPISIYVGPYVEVTKALFYENFRIRALQQGRITEDDFLTDEQRMKKYASAPFEQNANQYYTPESAQNVSSQNAYYNPANPITEAPSQPTAQEAPVQEAVAEETYAVYEPSDAEEAPTAQENFVADEAPAEDEIPTVEAENVTDEFE